MRVMGDRMLESCRMLERMERYDTIIIYHKEGLVRDDAISILDTYDPPSAVWSEVESGPSGHCVTEK
jgi:hypothetical protein